MESYFIAENSELTYFIQLAEPNWVLQLLSFNTDAEISQFQKDFHAKDYSYRIEGYYLLIVLTNKIAKLKNNEYRYYNKKFDKSNKIVFKKMIEEIMQKYWFRLKSRFETYKVKSG